MMNVLYESAGAKVFPVYNSSQRRNGRILHGEPPQGRLRGRRLQRAGVDRLGQNEQHRLMVVESMLLTGILNLNLLSFVKLLSF